MKHELKIKQCNLGHILEGSKDFEVRINDRDYQVGDIIEFLPLEDENYDVYSIRLLIPKYIIKYVHSGYGMAESYFVLGISEVPL